MPSMTPHFSHKVLIGMIHVGALPGSPGSRAGVEELAAQAAAEAVLLAAAGFDALIIENMHDAPYVHASHGPEVTAAMTRAALAVRAAAAPGLPLGVQVLSGGNREAIAVCLAAEGAFGKAPGRKAGARKDGTRKAGARRASAAKPAARAAGDRFPTSFIRCENFVFSHVADEGLLVKAEAGELLRYRRNIGAGHIKVFCDIKKKHASHAITADVPIADAAEAAEFFGADAVIVTGTATGKPVDPDDLREVREATRLPVLVGSGVTPDSAPELLRFADALIVGSWFKHDGHWSNPPDPRRCRRLVAAFNAARGG